MMHRNFGWAVGEGSGELLSSNYTRAMQPLSLNLPHDGPFPFQPSSLGGVGEPRGSNAAWVAAPNNNSAPWGVLVPTDNTPGPGPSFMGPFFRQW